MSRCAVCVRVCMCFFRHIEIGIHYTHTPARPRVHHRSDSDTHYTRNEWEHFSRLSLTVFSFVFFSHPDSRHGIRFEIKENVRAAAAVVIAQDEFRSIWGIYQREDKRENTHRRSNTKNTYLKCERAPYPINIYDARRGPYMK